MVRIAILDLYEGQPNQGMRCIRQIIQQWSDYHDVDVNVEEFDVRLKNEAPDLSYDLYISSGGPGSPLDSEGSEWEKTFFHWLEQVENFNNDLNQPVKKFIFFICHSFQLVCRHYGIGKVSQRRSTSFGVFPVHVTMEGQLDENLNGLRDPFYVVDSRDYQLTSPDFKMINDRGAKILCIEKYRPHVPLEQAIMAIRLNDQMIGTQFHPEADPQGMSMYLQMEEKKKIVIEQHGEEKWKSMIEQLNDPEKIRLTYSRILPNFLSIAAATARQRREIVTV